MKDNIESFLVFSMGLITGLIAGVLFAPHKGKTTRNMIKNRANESRDLANERLEEMLSKR